jgi:hypothetical protein
MSTMNISSSISQVIYQTELPGKILLKKAYLWPEYNAGKVHSIKPVQEKHEPDFNFIKRTAFNPSQENNTQNISKDFEYNSKGNSINIPNNYTPGSIFEALA